MTPRLATALRLVTLSLALVLRPATADDCCTPQATAKIAAAAGYLDIAGIKLGMEGKQAMDAMKADNAAFKIEPVGVEFRWECATTRVCNTSVKDRKWVTAIRAEVPLTEAKGREAIEADLTLPPNQQVVYFLSRTLQFPASATPTIDSLLDALKKKYGPPTFDYVKMIAAPKLKWIFDSEGKLLTQDQAGKLGLGACEAGVLQPILEVAGTGYRGKSPSMCKGAAVVMAQVAATTTGGNLAGLLEVKMGNFSLANSGMDTTNAALDQLLKQYDDKKLQSAGSVATPKL
jgi:hypothetical protein